MDVARGYPFYPNGGEVEFALPIPTGMLLSLVWVAGSVLVAATIAYRDGDFRRLDLISLFRSGYSPVPTGDNGDFSKPSKSKAPLPNHVKEAVVDAFNMFDPADLPPRLAEYANMVYSACEDLGNFFGFQDSSVLTKPSTCSSFSVTTEGT